MNEETSPRPRVVCFGEVLWDLYPDARHLGGAPANVAVHARQLGAEAHLWSRVGQDALGDAALQALTARGVRLEATTRDPSRPTGSVVVSFTNGQPSYDIRSGAAWDHIEFPRAARWLDFDAFCFGSLAQRTRAQHDALVRQLAALRRRGAPRSARQGAVTSSPLEARPWLVFDVNLRPPFIDASVLKTSLFHADLVKLNEEELVALGPLLETRDVVDWLFECTPTRALALTRGAHGARLTTRHVDVDHPGFPSSGVDPVGAGDAFLAALVIGACRSAPWPETLERANRYAAWVASERGAMPLLHARRAAALRSANLGTFE